MPGIEDDEGGSGWVELRDSNGSFYYHNKVTNETSWELPSAQKDAGSTSGGSGARCLHADSWADAVTEEQHALASRLERHAKSLKGHKFSFVSIIDVLTARYASVRCSD